MKKNKNKSITKILANKRWIIQLILGILLYIGINWYQISLWWVLAFGTLTGIIWGKVFCRWMCPVGIIMELIMKMSPSSSFRGMYQYHKIGCPIAWVSGWLNKFSLYKINLNADTCSNCGLCDKACYMTSIDKQKFSLYKPLKTNPAENFSCSKCLKCVEECPNGSLSFVPVINVNSIKNNIK
ncbi:MAG: 4Fe-4S binding protein [Saprospiraceae bacterium]|nr:4Fe-4S binding protein [Saprospiraceae bacterium]